MSTTAVSPLSSVQERIQDKIKSEFVNLIPDEMWAGMVESVVKDFTNDIRKDNYGRTVEGAMSPMKQLIRKEIDALAAEAVKAELARVGQAAFDNMGQRVVGEAMKKLIADNFDDILKSVQEGIVTQAVGMTISHMRNAAMSGRQF